MLLLLSIIIFNISYLSLINPKPSHRHLVIVGSLIFNRRFNLEVNN
ncbi:unnamed protein product [Rhodiola kirilowii]